MYSSRLSCSPRILAARMMIDSFLRSAFSLWQTYSDPSRAHSQPVGSSNSQYLLAKRFANAVEVRAVSITTETAYFRWANFIGQVLVISSEIFLIILT